MDSIMRSIGGFISEREKEAKDLSSILGRLLGQTADLSGGVDQSAQQSGMPSMRPQPALPYDPRYQPGVPPQNRVDYAINNPRQTNTLNVPSQQRQPQATMSGYYNPVPPQPDSGGLSPVPFPGNPERAQMMLNATNEGVSSRDAFDLFNQGNQLNVPGQMNAPVAGAGLAGMSSPAGGDAGMASPYAAVPGNREETLIQKFMQRGFSRNVAIGMVAGAKSESGLDSTVNEKDPTVEKSRGGFGLFQFTGPRRLALEKFAAERNLDPADEDVQIDFASQELRTTEKGAFAKINAAETAQDAALAVVNDFLRPGKDHSAKTVEAAAALSGEVLAPVDNKPATIESILSDLTKDPDNAEAKAKSRGQGEMWMALGKGLGQIGKGQAVDISTIVQMRQQRLDKAADTLKAKQRNTAAAALIYDTTGDEKLARAAYMGVVDYNTVLTKQQIDRTNKTADQQVLQRTIANNGLIPMLAGIGMTDSQIKTAEELSAAGGDVAGYVKQVSDVDVIQKIRTNQARQTQIATNLTERAVEAVTAHEDGTAVLSPNEIAMWKDIEARAGLANNGEAIDLPAYKKAWTPDTITVKPGDQVIDPLTKETVFKADAAPVKPSSDEAKITRVSSANPELTRAQVINIVDNVYRYENGVFFDTSTGNPVTGLTAGLSPQQPGTTTANTSAAAPGPTNAAAQKLRPLKERLLDNTGWGAVKPLIRPFGLLGLGTPFVPEAATEQDLGTWNQGLRDAFRMSGKLTAPEIEALEREVTIKTSLFRSPDELAGRIEAVDQNLARRIEVSKNRAADPGVSPEDRKDAANLAFELERLRGELNDGAAPQEVLAPNAPVDVTGMDDPKISGLKEGSIIRLPNGKLQKVVFEEETD